MMRIGIDVNGVLRDTINKFEQIYEKYLINSDKTERYNQIYELDISGNTKEITTEDNFQYKKISDVNSLEFDKHFSFKNKEEIFNFMYEEYSMELFGHASSSEINSFNTLNEFYYKFRDNYELIIVSNEIGKSKPATLFFLSKFGCLIEKIIFYSEITKNNMWNEIDVLLTSDPLLLLKKPENKLVIKYNTIYNQKIKTKFEIDSLSDFEKIINKVK